MKLLKRHELSRLLERRTNLRFHEGSGKQFWGKLRVDDYVDDDKQDRGCEYGFSLYEEPFIEMTIRVSNYENYMKNMVDGVKKRIPNHNRGGGGLLEFKFSHNQVDMMVDMINQFEGLTFYRNENYFPFPQLLDENKETK